jgi:hypothetical protein
MNEPKSCRKCPYRKHRSFENDGWDDCIAAFDEYPYSKAIENIDRRPKWCNFNNTQAFPANANPPEQEH